MRWQLDEAAIVTVPHAGGLPEGTHEVAIDLRLRMSYIPIEHQPSTYRVSRHITLTSDVAGDPFQYGVSLYSYMGDFGTVLDLESAFAHVADVGATALRSSARVTSPATPLRRPRGFDEWFRLLEKYSLEPTNYGSWIDTPPPPRGG